MQRLLHQYRQFSTEAVSAFSKVAELPPSSLLTGAPVSKNELFIVKRWNEEKLVPAENAFVSRVGLSKLPPKAILECIFHPSILPQNSGYAKYRSIGKNLCVETIKNYLLIRFPKLPKNSIEYGLDFFLNSSVLSDVAKTFSLGTVLKASPSSTTPLTNVIAGTIYSIIGAIKCHSGSMSAQKFILETICYRSFSVEQLDRIENPKKTLTAVLRQMKKTPPVSRLLHETGRLSCTPLYLVGVYSGLEKMGEGAARSIREAERRAARDALHKMFFVENPNFKEDVIEYIKRRAKN